MQNDNITPALNERPPSQMSPKEFQQMLYSWFEEKGLVSDLRSHLRLLMIRKLRNTAVGRTEHPKPSFSLKKQAFSLVIAEHLLREGCHYTLSVFSTEVPNMTNQLPFSLFEAHRQNEAWRFDQDSVLNVLELIGISKNSNESMRILALYFRNYGSLLSCLVSSKAVSVFQDTQIQNGSKEDVDGYLDRVLTIFGVPSTTTDEMKRKIQERANRERDKSNAQFQEQLQRQLAETDSKIKQLVDEQLVCNNDKKLLQRDLKEARKRLNQMILREKTLKLKEGHIKERLEEVGKLQEELKEPHKKNVEVCREKHCTEVCRSNEQLKDEVTRLKEIDEDKTLEAERLHAKMSGLLQDLKGSQSKIEFLNSCLLSSSHVALQHGDNLSDSGEESSYTITGEVVRQARSRLQQLEQESDELDTRCKQLILG